MAKTVDAIVLLYYGPEAANVEWDLVYGHGSNAEILTVGQFLKCVLKTFGLGQ